ncbi:hypothetical protein [Rufibacter roseus]|uniref:Uncharacterized protein n=1 Tax=Rufibacter roseus TaxID=1567108 RepID=A0ABW2DGL9_9BACT|nr:hypothetical protein [Rufibacter roseus]
MINSLSRKVVLCSLVLGSTSLFSCEQMLRDKAAQENVNEMGQAESATEQAAEAAPKEPLFEITYPKNSKYTDLTPPAGVKPNPFEEIEKIAAEHKDNENWADKHADIKGVLLQNEQKDYYFVLQQLAANEMLRNELFHHYYQDPGNTGMLQAIGFYTDHLVEAKSEDSELIYKSLRALKDYWPQDKIAKVAMATAARVQARPIEASADTASRNGKYRQVYARELQKMANRMNGNG